VLKMQILISLKSLPIRTPLFAEFSISENTGMSNLKKERANRAKAKVVETKEVRLGRSMKIDPHDVGIRINQARKFLLDGHKVLIVQNFRGREMMHKERGDERMKDIIERLSNVSKVETPPRFAGRRQTMVLAPDKTKIQSLLDALASTQEKNEKDQPEK